MKSVFPSGGGFPREFIVLATSTHSGNAAAIGGHRYVNGLWEATIEPTYAGGVPVDYFSWVEMTYAQPYYALVAKKDLTCLYFDGTKKKFKAGEVISQNDWAWYDVKSIIVY